MHKNGIRKIIFSLNLFFFAHLAATELELIDLVTKRILLQVRKNTHYCHLPLI